MAPNVTNPASRPGHDGVREGVDLGGLDGSENTTFARLRTSYIARRYDLPMPIAAVVAALALGGAP